VAVPVSNAPAVPVPALIESETDAFEVVSVVPSSRSSRTTGWVTNGDPAVAPPGETVNVRLPTPVISNPVLVAEVNPAEVAESRYPVPDLSIESPVKPALGPLRLVVPPNTAPPAPVPALTATVTDGEAVDRFPN